MQKINLYRYEYKNGAVIITPNKHNESDTPNRVRLIADAGYSLTNSIIETTAIDVMFEDVKLWSEVAETVEIEQKAQAYDILMGVSE